VIAVVVQEDRFLMIHRSAHVVAPGALCFAGGGIEGDETEEQALVREFREELGASIAPVCCVWRSATRWHVELAWWLAALSADVALRPNPSEVESVHWLSAAEALDAEHLLDSNRAFLMSLARGEIILTSSSAESD
jgi:8-oxo-dGTP diphosphatase